LACSLPANKLLVFFSVRVSFALSCGDAPMYNNEIFTLIRAFYGDDLHYSELTNTCTITLPQQSIHCTTRTVTSSLLGQKITVKDEDEMFQQCQEWEQIGREKHLLKHTQEVHDINTPPKINAVINETITQQPLFPYTISSTYTVLKSSFQGFAFTIQPTCSMLQFTTEYLTSLPGYNTASHHIWALKRSDTDYEYEDGGEAPAGKQLAQLLLSRVKTVNIAVVVWRWYGGTHCGRERFRMIGKCAVEALENGGWILAAETKHKSIRS